ncbi:MAG: hypothetical protein WKG32_05915 [Gemmatimonadaceae bacterium]
MPSACASAVAMSRGMRTVSPTGISREREIRARSDSPGTNGIT